MIDSYSLSLLVLILFSGMTVFIVRKEKSWFSPSSLFSISWCLVMAFSLLSAPDYYFSPVALILIMSLVFTFFVGGRLYKYFYRSGRSIRTNLPADLQKVNMNLKKFYSIAVMCGFISVFLLLRESGMDFDKLFDWSQIKRISSDLTTLRYAGGGQSGITMLFLSIAYSGAVMGGWMFFISKRLSGKSSYLIILFPILIYTFICTARGVFLFAVVLWISGFLSANAFSGDSFSKKINAKNILYATGVVVFLYLTLLVTQAMRMNMNPLSNFGFLSEYIKSAVSGNLSAFSIWVDNFDPGFAADYFKNTFGGVFEMLGLHIRKSGVYKAEYDVNGQMSFTNIFTLFRFLVDDLSIYGTYIFLFVTGFAGSFLFDKSQRGSAVHAAILPPLYALLLWSFIASILAYNTVLFACFIFSFFIFFFHKK